MNDTWIERWNDRYSKDEYAYGEQPNNFLREELEKLKPGTILFPAEGEGRNAVFAAALPSESPVSGTLMHRSFLGKLTRRQLNL
jgi:hypothetical protein